MQKRTRQRLFFVAKLASSVGVIAWIFHKILERENADELLGRLGTIRWPWIAVAVVMQLAGITCSLVRWDRLLVGQGIHAPARHLVGSFMIGRFFGAFTPGGWTGLNGYRLYDIAKHTGKTARSTAVIGIEMLLGWLAFGAVVIVGSIYGHRYIGTTGVVLVDLFFAALIIGAVVLLSRPTIVRVLAARLPGGAQARAQNTIDAVCAYHGKGRLVASAALLGMGTHSFHCMVYVAAAHALGANLGVGDVFFVSSMQVFATLIPASVNGVGIREAAAVALYTRVGVPPGLAVLIPLLGFAVEMFVSAWGGLVFVARGASYRPAIVVDEADREELARREIAQVAAADFPRIGRSAMLGLRAGLLAGSVVGLAEALVVVRSSHGAPDWSVLPYGAAAYAIFAGMLGLGIGAALASVGRLTRRASVQETKAFARTTAAMIAAAALGIGAFRIRRDWFAEELVWKSPKGALVAAGVLVVSVLLYAVVDRMLRFAIARRAGRFLLKSWGSPLLVVIWVVLFAVVGVFPSCASTGPAVGPKPPPPAQTSNLLVLVVDTLRADHLPAYGYAQGSTPHLDAFGRDAIRFDQAFANSSWTRPSFASILTGRHASSHRVMSKSDALADELVTLPEALAAGGFATRGIATNFNVAPFFNFQQGFDQYTYLEPNFVLGANDTAAKLLLIQFLRQRIETFRYAFAGVEPGTAYQDATKVNREMFRMLDELDDQTFFLFVGYMDPHDPYFEHPYNGSGYARAAHQTPALGEAAELTRLYDGEVTFWDDAFGAVVADLKRRGIYDNSTIVITSDHGEELGEHGGFWHGTTLYDEQVRVPLLVKLPNNQRAGEVVHHWVQLIDLMPTLLRLSGLETPPGVQGGNFFEGTHEVFAEEDHEGNALESLRTRRGSSELKVIRANDGNPRGLAPLEMFRMDQDAHEHVNLAEEEPEVATLAVQALDAQRTRATQGAVSRRQVDTTADANARDRLRALGYAGAGE